MNVNIKEEERIEAKILSFFLKWSVIVSAMVITAGIIILITLYCTGYCSSNISLLLGQIKDTKFFPVFIPSIFSGTLQEKSFAIIQLGILFLIASPFIRVLLQIGIYVKENDKLFTLISTVVFIFLIVSIILPTLIKM
ncbi:MAG: DUF1634 domain-containing protein [Candidatus Micrarchaeaceae archaeon]